METNDAPLRPGRHTAATPDRPPVSRRGLRAAERREISAAEFQDTWDFPGAPRSQAHAPRDQERRDQEPRDQEPSSAEAATSRRARRTAEAPALPAAAHHAAARRRPRTGGVARRTAMSMAGSGVALVGIAVAAHKAPDSETLDEAT